MRDVYNDFIACPSLIETIGMRVPVRNIIDIFSALFSYRICHIGCDLASDKAYNNMNTSDDNFFIINLLFNLVNLSLPCFVTFSIIIKLWYCTPV
jgi:hypothetical protein